MERNKKQNRNPLLGWAYGGKDREFMRKNRERTGKHNFEMAGHLLLVMTLAAFVYCVLDLNSSDKTTMRFSYLACLVVAAGMLLLHHKVLKKRREKISVTVYYISVTELVFIFLLFVGPIFDPVHTACYIPAYFLATFLLPIAPMNYLILNMLINLGIFAAVDFYCKGTEKAVFDIINSATCIGVGLALGENILTGRLNEISAYALLQETSRRELKEAMHMVNTDSLTGVKTRAVYESTEKAIDRGISSGTQEPFALFVADVNNLKRENDTYGHARGDALIYRCSRILCDVFAHSPVYRIGGDEFAVLLRGADYENRAKLMEVFHRAVQEEGRGSLLAGGLSEYRLNEDTRMEDVFRRADALMYEEKQGKR